MKVTIHRTGLNLLAENEEERILLNTLSAARRYEFAPMMARRSKRLNLVATYPAKEAWKSGVIYGKKHIQVQRQKAKRMAAFALEALAESRR